MENNKPQKIISAQNVEFAYEPTEPTDDAPPAVL